MTTNIKTASCNKKTSAGFSLVEMMISITLLAVGLIGLNSLFVTAMLSNDRNNHDTAATMISQKVLEQISALPTSSTANISVTDCAGNALTIATTAGAAPTGAGAPLLTSGSNLGNIDQTAAKVANYSMTYVACAPAGSNMQTSYDVRWNVMTVDADTRLISVSARQLGGGNLGTYHFAIPVNLRSIGGR
jgi:prepilin-type N-terminal cleavage/methylation domain-containing protein